MTDNQEEFHPIPAHQLVIQLVPKITGCDLEQEMSEQIDVTHLVQPEIWYGRVQMLKSVIKALESDSPSRTRLIEALQAEAEYLVADLLETLNRDKHKLVMYVRNGFLDYLATLPPSRR